MLCIHLSQNEYTYCIFCRNTVIRDFNLLLQKTPHTSHINLCLLSPSFLSTFSFTDVFSSEQCSSLSSFFSIEVSNSMDIEISSLQIPVSPSPSSTLTQIGLSLLKRDSSFLEDLLGNLVDSTFLEPLLPAKSSYYNYRERE